KQENISRILADFFASIPYLLEMSFACGLVIRIETVLLGVVILTALTNPAMPKATPRLVFILLIINCSTKSIPPLYLMITTITMIKIAIMTTSSIVILPSEIISKNALI